MRHKLTVVAFSAVLFTGVPLVCSDDEKSDKNGPLPEPIKRIQVQRIKPKKPQAAPKTVVSAAEKKLMTGSRYQVFRVAKEIKDGFLCKRCAGKGTVKTKVAETDDGRILKTVTVNCPVCDGTKIAPSKGIHDLLSKYYARLLDFEAQFPQDAPLLTDLEAWIAKHVQTKLAVLRLNADGAERLRSGASRAGDVYVLGVQSFTITSQNDIPVVQAWLHPRPQCDLDSRINLMIIFDQEVPAELTEGAGFVLLAIDQGDAYYEAILGNKVKTRVLSAIWTKKMTARQLPWD